MVFEVRVSVPFPIFVIFALNYCSICFHLTSICALIFLKKFSHKATKKYAEYEKLKKKKKRKEKEIFGIFKMMKFVIIILDIKYKMSLYIC